MELYGSFSDEELDKIKLALKSLGYKEQKKSIYETDKTITYVIEEKLLGLLPYEKVKIKIIFPSSSQEEKIRFYTYDKKSTEDLMRAIYGEAGI